MYIFNKTKCGEQSNFLLIPANSYDASDTLGKSFHYAPADAPAISAAEPFFPGNYEVNVYIHPVQ
jgi:hypothetical protein